MSANSLEEMLCEWEKLAKAASDEDWKYSGMSVRASAGIIADIPTPQRGGTFLCCANRDYIVHSDPAFALSLISLVRSALAPHLPVEELPETVERPSIRQREECTHDTLRYYTVDYVYGDDFKEYADAIEAQLLASQAEVASLRKELFMSMPVEMPFVNLGTGPVDMNANVWPSQEAVDADEAKVIKSLKSLREES